MEKNHRGIGEANGKIILLGEHSVVYNKPSIAIPFPAAKIHVTVIYQKEPTTIHCDFYHGLLDDMPELLESLKATVKTCLSRLNKTDNQLSITIDSHIPAERGMGSSAAVAVATTRALYHFYQTDLTQENLLEIVDISEKIAHGNPSGLDALMTSSSIPYYFIKGQPFEPINLNLDAFLIVADTGITGQTREAVASIAEKLNSSNQALYQQKIDELGHLAEQGRTALETNKASLLGKLMTSVHSLLRELDVSNNQLDHLVATALKHQALGAKLTGGGRGGCMIALARTKYQAETIAQALHQEGAKKTWLYQMNGDTNE
ncbi:mevalonate kinase [Vagococcus vulneris]|uniref:Mevalonate kinase n=1 Tax=Vagococcus vulneris TaxID=1977869 RepID=A0A429ZXS5_9ENTE|nr:mevalonate kinase [Vagococcus vulneris]RST98703.1 mevalonate kinase [Vagococcus vulneris]